MEKYNELFNELAKTESKCFNNQCTNTKEDGFDLCKFCIKEFVRICTCNKSFIIDKPTKYILGKKNSVIHIIDLPEEIPEFFYTQINGNIYHILGCRGCQHISGEISVKDNFKAALQASIISCVYQKYTQEDGKIAYEYLSDIIDPDFEEYAIKQNISLGEPVKILPAENI